MSLLPADEDAGVSLHEDFVAHLVIRLADGWRIHLDCCPVVEDWWAASPGARRAGLPAQLHRVATARAAVELVEEFGCRVEIVAG